MKVKALVSFTGEVTMAKGQTGEIADKAVLQDLIKAKYVEALGKAEKEDSAEEEPKKGKK